MSKRRAPTFGDLADGAAGGRRVVVSVGSLDGVLLQALAKVQLVPNDGAGEPSTWGEGITDSNPFSQLPEGGRADGTSTNS